jgi:hypothetical protein
MSGIAMPIQFKMTAVLDPELAPGVLMVALVRAWWQNMNAVRTPFVAIDHPL